MENSLTSQEMQRNLDLIRQILIEAEKKQTPNDWIVPEIKDHTKNEICYHIKLLTQAGYVESIDLSTSDGFEFGLKNLTWRGHEFLDSSRSETIWKKAKDFLGPKISKIPFEVLKSVLVEIIKNELKK